jgi:hypothetical protein
MPVALMLCKSDFEKSAWASDAAFVPTIMERLNADICLSSPRSADIACVVSILIKILLFTSAI